MNRRKMSAFDPKRTSAMRSSRELVLCFGVASALLLGGCYSMGSVGKGLQYAGPDQGVTDLHRAVERGDFPDTQRLLASGADPKARTRRGWTPLFIAVRNGEPTIADYLLSHGSERVDEYGYSTDDARGIIVEGSLINHAIAANFPQVVELLVDHGARLEKPTGAYGDWLMEEAIGVRAKIHREPFDLSGTRETKLRDNLQIIQILLKAGLPLPDENAKQHGTPKLSAGSSVFADDADLQRLRGR